MTRFKSFWTRPTVPAKNAVNAPKNATINKVELLNSNNIEHRIIKKTPAVTKVAACISAETGVGPSIASGNHIWSPNCADFPRAPQNNKKSMRVILTKGIGKMFIFSIDSRKKKYYKIY